MDLYKNSRICNEEGSVYEHITGLCENLAVDLYRDILCKQKVVKKLRSRAFSKLLFFKNVLLNNDDDTENDVGFLVSDVYFQIHCLREKNFYNSTEEKSQNVIQMLEKLQQVAENNSEFASVLQLLLLLADTKTYDENIKDPIFGLDLRRYANMDLRQPKRISYSIPADSEFECQNFTHDLQPVVPYYLHSRGFSFNYPFERNPGSGLSSYFDLEKGLGPFQKDLNEEDFESVKWRFPPVLLEEQRPSRTSIHADEGYVTPDNDHIWDMKSFEQFIDYWDGSHLKPSSSFRTWIDLGSKDVKPERVFISQSRTSVFHLWRIAKAISISRESDIPSTQSIPITMESLGQDVKNLLVAIESETFYFNQECSSFAVKEGVYIEGISHETLKQYCQEFIGCANSCYLLTNILNENSNSQNKSQMNVALSRCVERYLQCYRGFILCLPVSHGLLKMNHWVRTFQTQLEFLTKLCCVKAHGGALLVYIYNKVCEVVRQDLAYILYYILESCCLVYFRVLEKWIFEGVCDDDYKEFFIEAKPETEITYDRFFWTRGFTLKRLLVPGFIKGLENDLLICGKSVSLLKLSNVNDPLLQCLKRGYPEVICCLDQDGLDHVFTECLKFKDRCIDECGSRPRIFHSMTEEEEEAYKVSVIKQREKTLEQIRKAREENRKLEFAHKQEVFKELKKDMEHEKARKIEARQSQIVEETKILEIALELERAEDLRRIEERERLAEYYKSLSATVEKQRLKSEWKLKRLELNQLRLQFLQNEQAQLQDIPKDGVSLSSGDFVIPKIPVPLAAIVPESAGDGPSFGNSGSSVANAAQHLDVSIQAQLNKKSVIEEEFNLCKQKTTSCENICDSRNKVALKKSKEDRIQEELKSLEVVRVDANEARQRAVKNRENSRAYGREYNIITGEQMAYINPECNTVDLEEDKTKSPEVLDGVGENNLRQSVTDVEDNIDAKNDTELVNLESNDIEVSFKRESSCVVSNIAINENVQKSQVKSKEIKSRYKDLDEIDKSPITMDITNSIPSVIEKRNQINMKQIDNTDIFNCLQKSISYPLQTQLKLVNDALLRLFINEHNLIAHLDCLRKYFFLLDGDYGCNLTKNLFSELQFVKRPALLLNHLRLNSLLRTAVGNNIDENSLAERLSFRVNNVPTSFNLIDPNALACLSMTYKAHWPLNVIITPAAISKYDRVFMFLMQLRRALWALEQDIYLLKIKIISTSSQYRQVQLFRHIMAQFVQAVQNYVMTTVIEQSWLELKKELAKASTLETLYATHVNYIKKVMFRCLLNKRSKPIHVHLLDLFRIILTFHENLRSDNWTEEGQHPAFLRLDHQYKQFCRLSNFLFRFLERLVTSGYQPHLEQLLTLLSCNNFYKTTQFGD